MQLSFSLFFLQIALSIAGALLAIYFFETFLRKPPKTPVLFLTN